MGMIVDLAVIDYCRQTGIQTGRQADMDRYRKSPNFDHLFNLALIFPDNFVRLRYTF
jgi:hypothetical protein